MVLVLNFNHNSVCVCVCVCMIERLTLSYILLGVDKLGKCSAYKLTQSHPVHGGGSWINTHLIH